MPDSGSRQPRHAAPGKPLRPAVFWLLLFFSVAAAVPFWLFILGGTLWEDLRYGTGRQGAYPGLLRVFAGGGAR